MTHILDLNAQMGLRGLKWFAAQSDMYFDFDFILEKRLQDGTHDWNGQYPGLRVTVENMPEKVLVFWSFVFEDGSEGVVEADMGDIPQKDYRTLVEHRNRIIANIKDYLESTGVKFEIMYE